MKRGFFFKSFCLHKETGLARLVSRLNLLAVDLVHCKYTHANKNVCLSKNYESWIISDFSPTTSWLFQVESKFGV